MDDKILSRIPIGTPLSEAARRRRALQTTPPTPEVYAHADIAAIRSSLGSFGSTSQPVARVGLRALPAVSARGKQLLRPRR